MHTTISMLPSNNYREKLTLPLWLNIVTFVKKGRSWVEGTATERVLQNSTQPVWCGNTQICNGQLFLTKKDSKFAPVVSKKTGT